MVSMTIYLRLHCGLGNKFFQYCAAMVIKESRDIILYNTKTNHTNRNHNEFFPNFQFIDYLPNIANKYAGCFESWSPEEFSSDSFVLSGYFQWYPILKSVIPSYSTHIISCLSEQRTLLEEKYNIKDKTSVGFIHVRRGDYLTIGHNNHWVQSISYYKEALEKFVNMRWLILSDDISWCKEQEIFNGFECIDEPDELSALALMSLCSGGAIIANSTFSWWGAILGKAPTVYPSKWYGNKKVNLFPDEWIQI